MTHNFNHREFFTTIMAVIAHGNSRNVKQKQVPGLIPSRLLGKTGENLSTICNGGWSVAAQKEKKLSIVIMREAIDNGVNFFYNYWECHDGYAEEVMGKTLKDSKREKVFLMTKVCGRTYEDARHLEDSLTRMQLAKKIEPLTEEDTREVLAIAEPESRDVSIEVFKTQDRECNWHYNKYTRKEYS